VWSYAEPAALLEGFRARIGAVAVAWVGADGSIRSAAGPPGLSLDTFAIMAASMMGAARTIPAELGRSAPDRLVADAPDAAIFVVPVGPLELLVAVVGSPEERGHVLDEMARLVELLPSRAFRAHPR
jgi:predicted regulator of Ras-like GTPase activity (Roadblock/LC7/MglB family)